MRNVLKVVITGIVFIVGFIVATLYVNIAAKDAVDQDENKMMLVEIKTNLYDLIQETSDQPTIRLKIEEILKGIEDLESNLNK